MKIFPSNSGKNIIFFVVIFLLSSIYVANVAIAQETKKNVSNGDYISGIIRDRITKEPIIGVTVFFEEAKVGTISDENGYYSLKRPPKGGTLAFYFLGYETQKIKIEFQRKMDILMSESAESIEEVIVTGYGSIRKNAFSGNTTKVAKNELISVSKDNLISGLQAFDPSFRIKENLALGSNPNAMPDFTLRGNTGIGTTELDASDISRQSLQGNPNLPIFILDGFEVDIEKIYDLDLTRVHSVNILKDAAATAFYGSRAANGVIVIELRAPEAGKLRLQYNATVSADMPDLSSYNLMNAKEKLEAEKLAGLYDSSNLAVDPYTNGYYQRYNNILQGVDTYWLAQGLRNSINQRHSIYVDGGEKDVRWGIELRCNINNGVMRQSHRNTLGAGFYVDYRIGSFQIKNKITYDNMNSSNVPFNSFSNYSHLMPYMKSIDDNGYYRRTLEEFDGYSGSFVNPLYEIHNYNSYDKSKYNEITDNLLINWNINKNLKLLGQFSASMKYSDSDLFKDPASASYNSGSAYLYGDKTKSSSNNTKLDGILQLQYNGVIKDHNINLNLSTNVRQTNSVYTTSSYRGFPGGDLTSSNYAYEIINKPSNVDDKSRLLSALLTGNYSFRNIYFGDLTGRLDGSSEFGSNRRWSLFWASGAGINIHNFRFMKNQNVISTLKLRGSYGLTGKTNFSLYSARDIYDLISNQWYPSGYGVFLSRMGNPNLKWERTYKLDYGIELGLFRDVIYLKASTYNERTVDLITDLSISSSTGFLSRKENMGKVKNSGVELSLRAYLYKSRNWLVSANATFAKNKNRIVEISQAMEAYNKRVEAQFDDFKPGESTNSKYSKAFLKYYEGASMTAICGMRSLGISPSNGKEIYLRPNGDVTDNWNVKDWSVIGDSAPKGQGSFGVMASFKQFSLYTTFLYRFGGDAYNSTLVNYVENVNLAKENVDKRVLLDRWQKPGDVTTMKDIAARNQTTGASSRFIQKDNTLQFSSISISYDFDPKLIKKLAMQMCRLSFTANDLFVLSSIRQERGLDYPYARSFNLSLSVSF